MASVGRPKEGNYGMAKVAIVPMRLRPDDRSEMVNQLLFGERVEVLAKYGKSWRRVRALYDDYIGFVDPKQLHFFEAGKFNPEDSPRYHALELSHSVQNTEKAIPVLLGSELMNYDGVRLKSPFGKYTYTGQVIDTEGTYNRRTMIEKIARKYLHAPYLWGGKSPFGIDCSGFTQVVYKMLGIKLPRDAYQQIEYGKLVDFREQALPGDLAFFENKEGRIHHVSIILDETMTIHASGKVRIDYLDHYGIFRKKYRAYTHTLRVIKRIID